MYIVIFFLLIFALLHQESLIIHTRERGISPQVCIAYAGKKNKYKKSIYYSREPLTMKLAQIKRIFEKERIDVYKVF